MPRNENARKSRIFTAISLRGVSNSAETVKENGERLETNRYRWFPYEWLKAEGF